MQGVREYPKSGTCFGGVRVVGHGNVRENGACARASTSSTLSVIPAPSNGVDGVTFLFIFRKDKNCRRGALGLCVLPNFSPLVRDPFRIVVVVVVVWCRCRQHRANGLGHKEVQEASSKRLPVVVTTLRRTGSRRGQEQLELLAHHKNNVVDSQWYGAPHAINTIWLAAVLPSVCRTQTRRMNGNRRCETFFRLLL